MTGTDPERLERRLRWAAEQLGLSPDASPEEVRAAWLRRLPHEDFVPPTEQRWALVALLRRQPEGEWEKRADEAAAVEEVARLRQAVEAFVEKFWLLAPEDRRRHWQALKKRCAHAPAVQACLRLLEAGLPLPPALPEPANETREDELASQVRDLFLLRPEARARARQTLLLRMRKDWSEWRMAVRRLRKQNPALAALGADLLDKVVTTTGEPAQLPRKPPPRPKAATQPQQQSRTWPVWVIVGIAIGIVRAALNSSHPSPTPPTFTFPDKSFPWNEINQKPAFDFEEWQKQHQFPLILDEKKKKDRFGNQGPEEPTDSSMSKARLAH
jgi:hypothetical protein